MDAIFKIVSATSQRKILNDETERHLTPCLVRGNNSYCCCGFAYAWLRKNSK